MKQLKDFFYDKNDLVLTVAIIAIAALIIAWRMDVIMSYPATLAKETHTTNTTQAVDEIPEKPASEDQPAEEKTPPAAEAPKPVESLWINGTLSKDVTVSVASGSASAAVDSLISAEIFDSYDQYVDVCNELGLNPEDIKATTYTFTKGSSHSDIAKIITN